MSIYEIDHAATQARLDAANNNGLRALDECARRSAEIDKQVTQMRSRHEREKLAIDEQVRNAARPKSELPKRPVPRPATLALGGEEFREAKAARAQQPPLMPPRPPAPPMPPPGGQGRPAVPARPVPQAGTMSGMQPRSGVHIRRESQARPRPVHNMPPAVEKKQVTPPANDDPPHFTRRTLMLGAPEDREAADRKPPAADRKQPPGRTPPADDRKPPPRKPPAEGDDDLSGRTWLR